VRPSALDRSATVPRLLVVLAGLLGLFVLVGFVLRPSHVGDVLDGDTLSTLAPLRRGDSGIPWTSFPHLGDPSSYVQFCLALVLVAALRRRWRWVLIVPLTMLCSELSAQALKQLLAESRPVISAAANVGDAAWPSGHSTAVMTVALLAVLVAPRRARPTVAVIAAAGVLAVGFGILVAGFHYPTDIFGGYLCAAIWVTLAAIVLREWERRSPSPRRDDLRPLRPLDVAGPLLLLALGLATAVALGSHQRGGVVGVLRDHTATVVVVGALVALACTLVAATLTVQDGRAGSGQD
jgi:membrane-associated phospholipid phosphatase